MMARGTTDIRDMNQNGTANRCSIAFHPRPKHNEEVLQSGSAKSCLFGRTSKYRVLRKVYPGATPIRPGGGESPITIRPGVSARYTAFSGQGVAIQMFALKKKLAIHAMRDDM